MFHRLLPPSKHSFFLFGPRGTGKSTWIKKSFPDARFYDLLSSRETLRFSRDPSMLYDELSHLDKNSWVIIDEVQKVPALLDEVHRLIENKGLRFVLSGSSARKLRRGGANLLAGRARTVRMFPLVSKELGKTFDPEKILQFGALPSAITKDDPKEFLNSYVESYLEQEIKAEAIVKDIGNFARFLEIAARQNGQSTNVSNIARDAMVARQTVQGYFEILVDTLVGHWLPAWKLKNSTKNVLHSKFYFFDTGIVRALANRLSFPLMPEECGFLLETLILAEVRACLSYNKLDYPLYFWRNYDQTEVDLLCETPKGFLALEIKAAKQWKNQFNRGLHRIRDDLGKQKVKCLGVYQGEHTIEKDGIRVYSIKEFLRHLWERELF